MRHIIKGAGIFFALVLILCFGACGNGAESENNAEKDGVKSGETVKVEDSAEVDDAKDSADEKAKDKNNEADSAVKEDKNSEKSDETQKSESEKDEKVKEDTPEKESGEKSEEAEKNYKDDNSTTEETPVETQTEQSGSAEDVKKVADMVDMLNSVAGSMISDDMKGDAAVQFRADGTRVVMVLTMTGYSAEQIKTKKEKFEQSWAEMTDSYGMVSMIKDTEPAVTSVSLEVYGNDGNMAFSKAL